MAALVARERELKRLSECWEGARCGDGDIILLLGEAGIGKSALIEKFASGLVGAKVLSASATAGIKKPFGVLEHALGPAAGKPLFEGSETKRFESVFVLDREGEVLASAGAGDLGRQAEVLAAIQSFARDSFSSVENLGRMEYGELKMISKRGEFLTVVGTVKGAESREMAAALAAAAEPPGNPHETTSRLAEMRFTVTRDLSEANYERERIRVAERVLSTVRDLATEAPTLLVIEDLDVADESSIFVAGHMARGLAGSRILMVVTARDPIALGALAKEAERKRTVLMLEKLDSISVEAIVRSMYAVNNLPQDFASALAERCAGNPFFVRETIVQMARDGAIARAGDSYVISDASFTIPGTVEDLMQARLSTIDPEAMAMAEYASCMGREFDRSAAGSLRSVSNPASALKQLEDAGLVSLGDGARFVHGLYREYVYGSLADRWRQLYHRSLGEYYESQEDGGDERLFALAMHFSRSGAHDKSADYSVMAAERARAIHAPEQAVEHYRQALAALETLGGEPRSRRVEVLEALGDLEAFMGRFNDGLECYSEARKLAVEPQTQARLSRKKATVLVSTGDFMGALSEVGAAKGRVQRRTYEDGRLCMAEASARKNLGEYALAEALFTEALGSFSEGDREEAGMVRRGLGNLYRKQGRYAEALSQFKMGLAAFEGAGDEDEAGLLLNNVGNVLVDLGRYDEARESFQRGLEVLERLGDAKGVASIANNVGVMLKETGDSEAALAYYEKALDALERVGMRQAVATLLNNIGNVYAARGEFGKVLEYFERSLEMRREMGDKDGMAQSLNNLGLMHADMGNFDKAMDYHMQSLAIAEKIDDRSGIALANLNIAEVHHYTGVNATAVERYQMALSIFAETGDVPTMVNCHAGLAHVLSDEGNAEEALESARKGLGAALAVKSKAQESLARLALGRALAASGEQNDALMELREAGRLAAESGEGTLAARAAFEVGRLMLSSGSEDGRPSLESARRQFERMGMAYWIRRCDEALSSPKG